MARRYDHTPDEVREMAMQCGTEMLAELGYRGFSARGVAARMGYTVGTLYNLFENLDMFILHLNARTLEEWHTTLRQRLERTKGDKIRALARGYLEFSRMHYHRFMALFEHQVEVIPDWYKPKMRQMFELVEEALRAHMNESKKARHMAKVLWASIHGITVLSLSGKLEVVEADSAEKLMDTVIDSVLKYYR